MGPTPHAAKRQALHRTSAYSALVSAARRDLATLRVVLVGGTVAGVLAAVVGPRPTTGRPADVLIVGLAVAGLGWFAQSTPAGLLALWSGRPRRVGLNRPLIGVPLLAIAPLVAVLERHRDPTSDQPDQPDPRPARPARPPDRPTYLPAPGRFEPASPASSRTSPGSSRRSARSA